MRGLHCSFLWAALLGLALPAAAQDVSLIGVIGDKAAILSLKGGEPKTVKVGQTWQGVTVLLVEKERATVEIGGKKQVLARGQHSSGGAAGGDRQSVILSADARGHFVSHGAINGQSTRFLLDTGATVVSLPGSEARRLGIDYRKGQPGYTNTAAGPVPSWPVRLETVRLGGIELTGVEGLVIEQGLDIILLGNSFLNRLEMRRAGETMTLIRRY
jgi:aspartyl protease family protein